MKILILCPYSSGICGVFERVKQDALAYEKQGEEVHIFSSNAVKGSQDVAPEADNLGISIKIKRYPYKKLGGESFMKWDKQWIKDACLLSPDLIIAHNYRHPHTTGALEVAQMLKERGKITLVWLVSHSPFIEDNRTRSFTASIAVKLYDKVIGPRTINKFDKIIAICNWELPYLKKLGADESKIIVVPNPIAQEFHTIRIPSRISSLPKSKMMEDVLFLGRVSPIKDIETLIRAAHLCPEVKFNIVGPVELEYGIKLNALIKELRVKNVEFKEPVYEIKKKIQLIDNHKIFVLPSIREAMPTVLIEALARKKIIIASNNEGSREVLAGDKKVIWCKGISFSEILKPNCYLFNVGDYKKLAELIKEALK